MNFYPRRHRQAPPIIIISLIDVLIVMVVFLLVTTTYRNRPSLKLTLPSSSQAAKAPPRPGVNDQTIVVTVHRESPSFYIGMRPVTSERLQSELVSAVKVNPEVQVDINADQETALGLVVKVWDAAKAAGVKNLKILTRTPPR